MTDTTNEQAPETAGAEPSPMARMVGHYVRDLSFENVAAGTTPQSQGQPEIKINVGMDANKVSDARYQVHLKVTAKAEAGGETRFIAELDYVGIFELQNVKEQHVHPFLFIECPRQVLPFARRVLSDVTRDGGYPPLLIDNVDFAALYRQRLEEARAKRAEKASEEKSEA